MAELHVVSALRNKRAELAGIVGQLEQQLARQRMNLAHLDATMRLFDPRCPAAGDPCQTAAGT